MLRHPKLLFALCALALSLAASNSEFPDVGSLLVTELPDTNHATPQLAAAIHAVRRAQLRANAPTLPLMPPSAKPSSANPCNKEKLVGLTFKEVRDLKAVIDRSFSRVRQETANLKRNRKQTRPHKRAKLNRAVGTAEKTFRHYERCALLMKNFLEDLHLKYAQRGNRIINVIQKSGTAYFGKFNTPERAVEMKKPMHADWQIMKHKRRRQYYDDASKIVGAKVTAEVRTTIHKKIDQRTARGPFARRQAFKYFDRNGSGDIDPDELKAVMENFGLTFTDDNQVLSIYGTYDHDDSGAVDYSEFIEYVTETPHHLAYPVEGDDLEGLLFVAQADAVVAHREAKMQLTNLDTMSEEHKKHAIEAEGIARNRGRRCEILERYKLRVEDETTVGQGSMGARDPFPRPPSSGATGKAGDVYLQTPPSRGAAGHMPRAPPIPAVAPLSIGNRCEHDTWALREIRKYEKATAFLIPEASFQQLVGEIVQDFPPCPSLDKGSMKALQEASEAYVAGEFEYANSYARHAGLETVRPSDMASDMAHSTPAGVSVPQQIQQVSRNLITKEAIRSLAHLGGARQISGPIFEKTRGVLSRFLVSVITNAVAYAKANKCNAVTVMAVLYARTLKRQARPLYLHGNGRRSGQAHGDDFELMDELHMKAQASEFEGGTEATDGNTLKWSKEATCVSKGGCAKATESSKEDIQHEREDRSRSSTPELFNDDNFSWGAGLLCVAVGMALAAAPFALWIRKLQSDYEALATGAPGNMVRLEEPEEPSSPTPLKVDA